MLLDVGIIIILSSSSLIFALTLVHSNITLDSSVWVRGQEVQVKLIIKNSKAHIHIMSSIRLGERSRREESETHQNYIRL